MTLKEDNIYNKHFMFIKESLEDILKPKSKEEIKNSINSLSIEDKEDLIRNKLIEYIGDYDQIFNFLSDIFIDVEERIWDHIIESIYDLGLNPSDESGNDEEIDKEWLILNFNPDTLLEFYLESLKEKEIDKLLYYICNEFMNTKINESIENVFKPKDLELIINDIIKSNSIRNKYPLVIQIFNTDWDKIADEFRKRKVSNEDLIYQDLIYKDKINKVVYILNDIILDNKDKITYDMIKKSFKYLK